MDLIESTSQHCEEQYQINDVKPLLRLRGGGNTPSNTKTHRSYNRKNLQAERLEKLVEIIDTEMNILLEICEAPTVEPQNGESLDSVFYSAKEFLMAKEFGEEVDTEFSVTSSDEEDELIEDASSSNISHKGEETTQKQDSKNLKSPSFLSKERSSLEELIRNLTFYFIM